MKVFIAEDERPAMEMLVDELNAIDQSIEVAGLGDSVSKSVSWLSANPAPDLIFMDIQLNDGLSFEIFKAVNITSPVIFVSAFDKYLLQAFEYNSIDYLLKPVNAEKLRHAVRKYSNLRQHFTGNYGSLLDYLNGNRQTRSRVVVKKGMEFQAIKTESIAYFFTEHKLVFLVDKENRKYLAEKNNLMELEEELDSRMFYRANRKYIININFIKRYRPLEKSKIAVELQLPVNEEIIISQENAGAFKRWISET